VAQQQQRETGKNREEKAESARSAMYNRREATSDLRSDFFTGLDIRAATLSRSQKNIAETKTTGATAPAVDLLLFAW